MNADESQQVAENPAAQESAVAEVAEVNGTKYATLQEAFDAATNNCTISVLTNVDLGTENVSNYKTKAKNVTVDFGGNKITSAGDYTLAPLTSNWTFENGTIENTNAAASYGAVMVSLGSPNTVFKGGSNGLSIVSKTNGIFVIANIRARKLLTLLVAQLTEPKPASLLLARLRRMQKNISLLTFLVAPSRVATMRLLAMENLVITAPKSIFLAAR